MKIVGDKAMLLYTFAYYPRSHGLLREIELGYIHTLIPTHLILTQEEAKQIHKCSPHSLSMVDTKFKICRKSDEYDAKWLFDRTEIMFPKEKLEEKKLKKELKA